MVYIYEKTMVKKRKTKPTGYIHLTGYQFHESEGHLKTRLFLHATIINSPPSIVKYINKHELYRQYPDIRVKDTKMNEIEISLCVINVTTVTPVWNIER